MHLNSPTNETKVEIVLFGGLKPLLNFSVYANNYVGSTDYVSNPNVWFKFVQIILEHNIFPITSIFRVTGWCP